jgi:hypothetical protein
MHMLLVGLVFAAFAGHSAPAPDETAVMLPVRQFVDAFNKGDVKGATAVCSSITSIIDEFPPYEWHGAGTCLTWLNAYDADAKRNGISAGFVTLAAPRHVDIILEHAYVVVPADDEYTMKGESVRESGSLITISLKKSKAGWEMTAWAWGKN